MNMRVHNRAVSLPPSLLQTATEVLVADPAASLADVAAAAGIGRTTLHKQYPTRHALLVAIAGEALELMEDVYGQVGLDGAGGAAPTVLGDLADALIPLGPRLEFLLRERSLDTEPELLHRVDALDERLRQLVGRGQDAGTLRSDVPDGWIVASFNAQVCTAWELIALGRLAPTAASTLVMRTLWDGLAAVPRPSGAEPDEAGE